jgi:hypothetical protein
MNNITNKLVEIIQNWDAKGKNNESFGLIAERIDLIVCAGEQLQLATFTCSTISASKMFGSSPWEYVSLDPTSNNLTNDIQRMSDLVKELRAVYKNTCLRIIIGNTDPYYIYTQQFALAKGGVDELWDQFAYRWAQYKEELQKWVRGRVLDVPFEIVSWYVFEKEIERTQHESFEQEFLDALHQINGYAKASDLNWEFQKLQQQFCVGGYFEGLECPDDVLLRDWVRRKFAEYALQALWIREFMPNAILMQNEKPSDLRTAMYQPLVRERCNEAFPVLYVCGVDNEGYQ